MATRKFCPYCISPIREGEPCPVCGLTEGSYAPAPHHLPPGTVLMDRYLIGRVLGEGGFGITYIGCDLRLEMKVAIKEYFPTERVTRTASTTLEVTSFTGVSTDIYQKSKKKFLREARAMARMVKQPEIVGVRDFFEANNTAYIVMEYIEGTTLKELVAQRGGRIPAGELLHIMEPIFHALDVMHEMGLIHRDISPDNLMLERGNIRLLDFGCARDSMGGQKTMTVALKQGYAPIEQYQGKGQGPWTDVYALAATMYYCLTGSAPLQSLDRLVDDELILPRKLGVALTEKQEKALLYGMGIRPRRRFQSMKEFHAALYEDVAAKITYTVTYKSDARGTVKPESEKVSAGKSAHGAVATANRGSRFKKWIDAEGNTVSTDASFIPASVDCDTTYTAVFVSDGKKPEWRKWLRKNRAKVGAGIAAIVAMVLLIVGVRALINSGSPTESESTTDTAEAAAESAAGTTEATVSAGEADDVRAEMEALFADAQTFIGNVDNWEDFVAMLNDDSVPAVIIPEGTGLTLFSRVTITKPVLVEEDAYLGAWDTLTLDGENACIYVKGEFSPTSLLRTVNGGRVVVEEDALFTGCILWQEEESNFINLGGNVLLQSDEIVTCSERALHASSTEVATAEEFTAALNAWNTTAITVVGDITVDAGDEAFLYVPVPLIIDEGASLTVTAEGSSAWNNSIFMDAACLINYGTLNAFVNFRNANGIGVLDNEYGASWTGGTFETDAVLVNYGDMTVTQTNSCAKGSDQDLEETGHFINEGIFTVADGDFYVSDGIFCNTNSGTIIVDTSFTLMNGVTATNYGTIQVESSGYWYTDTLLVNCGTVEVVTGGQLGNSGVLLNRSGATVDSANTANNGLILVAEDSNFTSNNPGGRIETIAALESTPSGSWVTVSTAGELQSAMSNSSVKGIFLDISDSNCVVSGNLTVTKPLVIKNWSLQITGTLTVAEGYVVAAYAGIYAQSVELAENTMLFCCSGFGATNVTIGENATLYYTYTAYNAMENEWYYIESMGDYGQVTVDGGVLKLLSPITLESANITVSNGGTLQCCGYTVFEGCTVDIGTDSLLYVNSYRFDADTTVTNNGTAMQMETGIDFCLEGTLINNGTVEMYEMEVSGLLENNGQIICRGHGTNAGDKPIAFYTVDGGEIRGNEILTSTEGTN